MTWTLVGWVFIGLAAALLAVLAWIVKIKGYSPRKFPFILHYKAARTAAVEQGRHQEVVLGHQLWSGAYPGLGLSALSALPPLLSPETLVNGDQTISTSTGSLAVFAHQIVEGKYRDGFSEQLVDDRVQTGVYGVTPWAYTAGLLAALHSQPAGALTLLGDYGPEAALAVKKVEDQQGRVFAAAGSMASQAALFLNVRDMLLGEEVYLLPALLSPNPQFRAAVLVEDLLRVALILLLVVGAILKMAGVI